MRSLVPLRLLILLLLAALAAPAKEKAREETLLLFQQHRVTLAVPEGFLFSSDKDERGLITAKLTDPRERISLQISFLPDPSGDYASARGRKELLVQSFQTYVAGSVEQAMRFEELESRTGAGTYCIFTDAALAGKTKLPPGEYLHSTTGVKAWAGYFALFTLLSTDIVSAEYRAAMNVLRESLREKPSPLL